MNIFNHEVLDAKFWRSLLLIFGGVGFYFLVLNLPVILKQISWIFSLLQPFILGLVIAFLLGGMMRWFEKRVVYQVEHLKTRRLLSLLLTVVATLSGVILLFWFLIPQLGESLTLLLYRVPQYLDNLQKVVTDFLPQLPNANLEANFISTYGLNFFNQNLPAIFAYSGHFIARLFNILIGMIIAVYFLYNKEQYLRQLEQLGRAVLPGRIIRQIKKILRYGCETFTNFFYGKLLDSLIVGIICFIGLLFLQIPYPLLISVVIGLTNIIPFFGPFIGAIPTALLVLAVDPKQALWFVIFIIILQQFDGNILGPKIMGNSVGLPAIWVLFAVLVGGGLFGFTGMVLGIPVMAMAYKLIKEKAAASQL